MFLIGPKTAAIPSLICRQTEKDKTEVKKYRIIECRYGNMPLFQDCMLVFRDLRRYGMGIGILDFVFLLKVEKSRAVAQNA